MRLGGMRVTPTGISATFRIERRLDFDDARAQPGHHRLDDVIAPDAQSLPRYLGRQMPIAEVPGDSHQMLRIGAADFHERFRCRHDLDQPAVLENQGVAAPQRDGALQIKQKLEPACAGHRHPPAVTIVEIQHDRIGRWFDPAILSANLGGADHRRMSDDGLPDGLARKTTMVVVLIHEVALRHRQHFGGRAGQEFAVGAHLIGFRIDLDLRRGAVMDHALLGDPATGVLHRV
jgi:hypothetical protein